MRGCFFLSFACCVIIGGGRGDDQVLAFVCAYVREYIHTPAREGPSTRLDVRMIVPSSGEK